MVRLLKTILVVAFAVSACGENPGQPAPQYSGEVTDAAGDGGTADLVSASVKVADGTTTLRVEFAPGAFISDSLLVGFNFDTD